MSDNTNDEPVRLTGGCQCGAVRYALASRPTDATVCHCRMCQKASGGPFMAFGHIPLADVTWTRGQPAIFRSSSLATRGFCAACGTPLTFQWKPDGLSFTIASLDEPDRVVPVSRLSIETVLPWSEHVGALPIESIDAWMTPELAAGFVDHQHPDHDT